MSARPDDARAEAAGAAMYRILLQGASVQETNREDCTELEIDSRRLVHMLGTLLANTARFFADEAEFLDAVAERAKFFRTQEPSSKTDVRKAALS